MPLRRTLSDANQRRLEAIFECVYHDLYVTYRNILLGTSVKQDAVWMKRLQIIDSTTITLFSNLLFKGVGCKKKEGIKVHTVIHANGESFQI